jgi:DNA-binding CsgD family transcriptional regulator
LRAKCSEKPFELEPDLLKIVGGFYDASLSLAEWTAPLAALKTAVAADVCALAEHDFGDGSGRIVHSVGIDPSWIGAYAAQHAAANVWMQDERPFERVPAVIDGRSLVAVETLTATPFYRFWLHPLHLLDHAFVVLERRGQSAVYVLCARNDGAGPFSEGAMAILRRIAPELHRAHAAGRALRAARHANRLATDALDSMAVGVVVLNADGNLISANRLARAVIADGDALYLSNGTLAFDKSGRRTRMRDLIAQAMRLQPDNGQSPYLASALARRNDRRPLTLLLVPKDGRETGADAPVAVLYIGDPERPVRFDHQRIARLYGLSRAESRVAALLASGYRLDQISDMLGVAYETVRKHLKQVFSKTGTYRQAELVRVLVTGPAGVSL